MYIYIYTHILGTAFSNNPSKGSRKTRPFYPFTKAARNGKGNFCSKNFSKKSRQYAAISKANWPIFSCTDFFHLLGGWTNPFEKYAQVKLGSSSPVKGEKKKCLKPPPRKPLFAACLLFPLLNWFVSSVHLVFNGWWSVLLLICVICAMSFSAYLPPLYSQLGYLKSV